MSPSILMMLFKRLDESFDFDDVVIDVDEYCHEEHAVATIKNSTVAWNDAAKILKKWNLFLELEQFIRKFT